MAALVLALLDVAHGTDRSKRPSMDLFLADDLGLWRQLAPAAAATVATALGLGQKSPPQPPTSTRGSSAPPMKLLVPLLSLATFALAAVSSKAELPPRPNIVFIYSDDLRWDALGAVQREQGEKARFP